MATAETQQGKLLNNSLKLPTRLPVITNGSQYTQFCDNSALFTTSANSAAVALCYSILIPFTVLGNGSVIAAFVLNTKLRTAVNIFIIGLACSDLLVGTFAIPVWTFIVSHEDIMVVYCYSVYHLYICFDVFAGSASILQLTAIALERFISAQWPWFHRKMSLRSYWTMLFLAWLCAAVMTGLNPLQVKTATWSKSYSIVLTTLCFLIPFAIITTCYCCIFKISRFQARRRLSSGSNFRHCGRTPGNDVRELNVATTVLVITGVFLAAWLPFFVVTVIATFCLTCLPSGQGLALLVKCLKFLQYSSSCINPYIYAYRDKEMRSTITKIAKRVFPCSLAGFWTKVKAVKFADSKLSLNAIEKLRTSRQDICSQKEFLKEHIEMRQSRNPRWKINEQSGVVFL